MVGAERLLENSRMLGFAGLGILAVLAAPACKKEVKSALSTTVTLVDQDWPDQQSRRRRDEELRQFTSQTGIRVEVLPSPETAGEQLLVWRHLLDSHATVPDLYGIDVIWPVILADQLLDLKPYVPAQEIAEQFPALIAHFTVNRAG